MYIGSRSLAALPVRGATVNAEDRGAVRAATNSSLLAGSGSGPADTAHPDPAAGVDVQTALYHEIRSPLNLILTAARAAAEVGDQAAVRHHLDAIVRVAERTLRVATTVIETAREDGRPSEATSLYYPAIVLERFVLDLRTMGVPVEWEPDARAAGCLARGAASDFEALLHTAFEDALDHGEPGDPIRVALTVRRGPGAATLQLSIANRCAAAGHAGLGVGSHLRASAARRLGGTLSVLQDGADYQLNVTLPLESAPRPRRPARVSIPPAAPRAAGPQPHAGTASGKDSSRRARPAEWKEGKAC